MLIIKNQEYFDKVCKFANDNNLMGEFLRTLVYLDDYGCIQRIDGFDSSRNKELMKVLLFPDHMENSFYFEMYRLNENGTYTEKFWMNGGMIYFDSDKSWSIHT